MRPQAFVATIVFALPILSPAVARAQNDDPWRQTQDRGAQTRETMRFREMDTNHDGVITRSEWRGSDASFRAHDWNGDNVLSGDEVRVGAPRPINDEDSTLSSRPAFDDWTRSGFSRLDANGDGRITRTEWLYDLESFRRADRNGDGVLSRQEFVGNEQWRQADQFTSLDVNGDRRITRDEWQGSRRNFDRADRNGDGVLTRAEMASTDTGFAPVGTSGTNSTVVVVPSTERWFDTGIDIRAGEVVNFQATGTIRMSTGNDSDAAGPAGALSGRRADNAPFRDRPAGALIGRIGNGAPVFLGERGQVSVPRSGRLYLSVNDDYLQDNSGEYRVMLTVR